MKPKTEIYHIVFLSKYKNPDGTPIVYEYTVGLDYAVENVSIMPVKITEKAGRVIVIFKDGGSHSIPIDSTHAEIFRRPITVKETNTEIE